MSRTFEQFVKFTTDAAGLERILRLLQSIAQILTSYTLPFNGLLLLLSYISTSSDISRNGHKSPDTAATTRTVLLALRTRFNLARRFFRVFRFLDSFSAAQKLYTDTSSNSGSNTPRLALWLEVFSRTFNGFYLLLEASLIVDAQKIDGLALWGLEMEAGIAVEAQRFWLFALVCSALAGVVRLVDLVTASSLAAAPEPETVAVAGVESADAEERRENDGPDEKSSKDEKNKQDEQLARFARTQEVRRKMSTLIRRIIADTLDITLPGSIVGWVPASTGTVGVAMFVTTILTSVDIWERCGRGVTGSQ
ncbi:peroxisomal biogenesis factor 11-domain-containing protein [Nemania sp. FL0916]|nr:peroxisomal biogenesis factor 11-domain-containing protein [Nemania sp. FL0916]